MKAIVTVRLPRDKTHDPRNKKTGVCPLFSKQIDSISVSRLCTDITGEHHCYVEEGYDLEVIRKKAETIFKHVTRIEEIL